MITISHVVALSKNRVIGVNNDLPWTLKTDLRHFKEYTSNKIIVMGRKTYESIGRPLPNRIKLIVARSLKEINCAQIFDNTENALESAKKICIDKKLHEMVIIGGGYLFRDTLPVTNKLILSEVDCVIEGDIYYPEICFDEWNQLSSKKFKKDESNEYNFVVKIYEKIVN